MTPLTGLWRPIAGLLLAVALLAACSGSEREIHPDRLDTTSLPTVPPFADCSGESPVDPCVTPSETGPLLPAVQPPPSATAGSSTPVTCGPDPDETHPPPCD